MEDSKGKGPFGEHRAPIIIVAPTHRCGTTLLQRALNSTGDALIYGENFGFLENYPEILGQIFSNVEVKQTRTDTLRERVLAGEDIDASVLFPDYNRFARLMRAHFYHIAQYYDRESRGYGRSVWGIKHQIFNLRGFAVFLRLLPRARYIFVYRSVFDVVRSGKARFPQSYSTLDAFAAAGRAWTRNSQFLRERMGPNVLHLEYDELVQRPEDAIARLEGHCGVSGVDRAVFRRRVNVSPVIDRLSEAERKSHYRRPEELSKAELAALRPAVEAACRRFGYELPDVSA